MNGSENMESQMKRNLTAVVLVLVAIAAASSWLYLHTPQVGSVCLSGQGVKASADGSPLACASGTWKPQN